MRAYFLPSIHMSVAPFSQVWTLLADIAGVEIDYTDYRRAVKMLWNELKKRPIIRVPEPQSMRSVSRADFDDFIVQTSALPIMLQNIDSVSFIWVQEEPWWVCQWTDDGCAIYFTLPNLVQ